MVDQLEQKMWRLMAASGPVAGLPPPISLEVARSQAFVVLHNLKDMRRRIAKPQGGIMQQFIDEKHETDGAGNPAGGRSVGTGIRIDWQDGPLGRGPNRIGPNGAFVEGVIQAALGRIQYYQASKFKCRENAQAITKLEEALHWLNARTRDRETRDVEGTHTV